MDVVLDPNLIFIRESLWEDERLRDVFLNQIQNILGFAEHLGNLEILWSDDLEALIWTSPQMPPWRQDRDWKNQIVPVMYRRLNVLRKNVAKPTSCGPVTSSLVWDDAPAPERAAFCGVLHHAMTGCEKFIFCLSVMTTRLLDQQIWFRCDCVNNKVVPPTAGSEDQLLSHFDLTEMRWPSEPTAKDAKLFHETVNLFARQSGIKLNQSVNPFGVSEKFIRAIIKEKRNRRHILQAITRRLTLQTAEAGRDEGLQDEHIGSGVFRFRVTGASRIHYQLDSDGRKMVFDEYFGEGEHDTGL